VGHAGHQLQLRFGAGIVQAGVQGAQPLDPAGGQALLAWSAVQACSPAALVSAAGEVMPITTQASSALVTAALPSQAAMRTARPSRPRVGRLAGVIGAEEGVAIEVSAWVMAGSWWVWQMAA
jgi:hypothetical protein